MKKILTILLIILIIGAICTACFFTYKYFTNKTEVEKITNEPIFTVQNYPKVDGSTATIPLSTAFKVNFTGDAKAIVDHKTTHNAYVNLINKDADLILVTEPSEEELALAKEKGVELEVIPVVREGFVFYVNSNNPIDNLSLEQIQKIYTGEIKNWSEVGENDEEIKAYQRPVNSGSQTGMLSLVMKGLNLAQAPKEDIAESMEDIINLVSDYDNGANSIGYSYYYYATTMYDDIDAKTAEGIKLIGVDGIIPTYETIKDKTYPIKTAYYIVIRKDEKKDGVVRKLANAMLSARGQAVAKEAGYVPVK